jgi:hypothetical protein
MKTSPNCKPLRLNRPIIYYAITALIIVLILEM